MNVKFLDRLRGSYVKLTLINGVQIRGILASIDEFELIGVVENAKDGIIWFDCNHVVTLVKSSPEMA